MLLTDYLKAERGRVAIVAKQARLHPAFVSQLANGKRPVPADRAADLEEACGFHVRRWDMFPTTWHRIWPELVGTDGAPDVPADQAQEVRDAA
jgi:DNA-binding transcriptional regulator YdaS (Cro superfamily)